MGSSAAKLPWFRLYTEILDDPKLAVLTGEQFRMLIYFFCLARESAEPGLICLSPEDIAWRCRRSVEEVKDFINLAANLARPIIALRKEGIEVLNFIGRQYDWESQKPEAIKRRVQKHRAERKAKKKELNRESDGKFSKKSDSTEEYPDLLFNAGSNDEETTAKRGCNDLEERRGEENRSDQDKSNVFFKDTDIKKEGEDRAREDEKTPPSLFFENISKTFSRPLTTAEEERLTMLVKSWPAEVIEEAARRAVARGKKILTYVESIMRQWSTAGLTTMAAVMDADPPPKANGGQQSDDPVQPARAEPGDRRLEEGVRAALVYMRLTIGEGRSRPEVEEWLIKNDYGPEVTQAVKNRLFGGDG